MAATFTRAQAADAVNAASGERDAIQANLLDLDGSFGKRLLAGAALAGTTKQRWEAAATCPCGWPRWTRCWPQGAGPAWSPSWISSHGSSRPLPANSGLRNELWLNFWADAMSCAGCSTRTRRRQHGAVVACPSCGEPVDSRDSFCEACGKELAPAVVSAGATGYVPACPVCSADPAVPPATISADGYCQAGALRPSWRIRGRGRLRRRRGAGRRSRRSRGRLPPRRRSARRQSPPRKRTPGRRTAPTPRRPRP